MSTSVTRRFPTRIHAVAVVLLMGIMVGPGTGAEHEGTEEFDCGIVALHTLLALEGRATSLQTIREHLPPPHPQGYSLAELRDAAQACGLALVGVKLNRGDHAPDRSALVLTQLEEHGHFLVVRPVGHSGKLIQVIDPIADPIVMDAVDVYASREWTGLALIPDRPNWPLRFAISSTVVSGLAFVWMFAGATSGSPRGRNNRPRSHNHKRRGVLTAVRERLRLGGNHEHALNRRDRHHSQGAA